MTRHALLIDIGNVIVHFDFSEAAQRFAQRSAVSAEEVFAQISTFKDDLESGTISDEDFITQSIARTGFRGTRDEFIAIWGDIFTENAPMVSLVRRLHGTVPLYLFSNTSGLHKQWLFDHFDVFHLFSGGIYSHEAHCMKPHDEIYHAAVSQYGLDPAQTFYIDDLSANIATGKRLGFVTHHYAPDDHAALERAVGAWLENVVVRPE